MMLPRKTASKRKTVGVFLAQISRVWGTEFMAGVEQAAESMMSTWSALSAANHLPWRHPVNRKIHTDYMILSNRINLTV